MYFSYKINDITRWILMLALPYGSIMDMVNRIFSMIALIDAVLMLMLITALDLISKRMIIDPLGNIVSVINRLENGERRARVPVSSSDEFAILGREFNRLVDMVEEYSDSLEEKVRRRTEEIAALQQENTRLRIIEEKKRIYRDMHDALGSKLTNIFICNNVAQSVMTSDSGKLNDMLQRIEANCQLAIKNLKEIILGMKDDEQIAADFCMLTVVNIERRLKPKNIDFEPSFSDPEAINSLDRRIRAEIEKILQELVSNVLRHSGATMVSLELSLVDSKCNLLFRDNGSGFDYRKQLRRGSGLKNISYRVENLGGRIEVVSSPDGGTEFKIVIPLETRSNEDED